MAKLDEYGRPIPFGPGPEPEPTPTPSPGGTSNLPPLPPGYTWMPVQEKDIAGRPTGKWTYAPVEDKTFRLPPQGGAGRDRFRFPEEIEEAGLRNAMLRQQLALAEGTPEERAYNRAYREQRDAIDDAFKEAQFAFEKARDERNFGEQQRQFDLMQKLRERRAELDDKQFQVQTELGYAGSRRADLGVNLQRAEMLGYDPNGDTGVAPGTLTASERSRQYQQQLGVQDRATRAAEAERARQDALDQQEFGRSVTIRQMNEQEAARGEQERMAQIDQALNVAGRRGLPKRARTM